MVHENANANANVNNEPRQILNSSSLPASTTTLGATKPKNMVAIYKTSIVLASIGIALTIFGIATGTLWMIIYNKILLNELTLTESSKSYNLWKETPIPMYLKIHFFNWTNCHDYIRDNSVKPNFVEMGPYVFREVDYKIPIEWNDNDTLTFYQKRIWHFEQSMTNGSLNDLVTNLNPIAATVAHSFSSKKKIIKNLINRVMLAFNETFIMQRTVRELLFEGYEDKLLELAKKTHTTKLPFNKFGWFFGRNNSVTYDGVFNMLRGKANIHELGVVKEWNYSNRSEYYNGHCGDIRGTIGDMYPPLVDNKTISIFAPDICTALTLNFDGVTDMLDLNGFRFISTENMLDNGSKDPSRKCYCNSTNCQPSGTLNVEQCKYGAPVFISLPHFYLADASYRKDIVGMEPTKEKHEFYIVIEPITGIPMQVRAQLQVNLYVQPDEEFALFKNITKMYVPMLWFAQEATLTSDLSQQVKIVKLLPMLGHITLFSIGGIGVFLMIITVFVFMRTKRNNEDRQVLLKD